MNEKGNEDKHVVEVLEATREALKEKNTLKLKELSNQTIHSASTIQDDRSILIAVILYTLNKLLERRRQIEIQNWGTFEKKFDSLLKQSTEHIRKKQFIQSVNTLKLIRKALESLSPKMKPYIQEVFRKASINKASRIYEHGVSMERTAKLLGVTQWELTEYAGQSKAVEIKYDITQNIKRRAKMALEFFK